MEGNLSGTFSGELQGLGAAYIKVGTGVWTLTGQLVVLTGQWPNFVIDNGTIVFNFSDASGANAPVSAITSGFIQGTGTVGPIDITGNGGVGCSQSHLYECLPVI